MHALFSILFCMSVMFFSFLEANQINPLAPSLSEPIDVVIPCTDKDLPTLEMSIQGIKENGKNIRRVVIISSEKLSDNAEWFNETDFPFQKYDIAVSLFKGDTAKASEYLKTPNNRIGWYYQQLLKLYAPFVIPNISSNVLIVDADTVFLNPVYFISPLGKALYNPSHEYHPPYFCHMAKLTERGVKRLYNQFSGISHHMLFQKEILQELFNNVESIHNKAFWDAFCSCVDDNEVYYSGASEYEVYFNFVLSKPDIAEIRPLQWATIRLEDIPHHKKTSLHYISSHSWMR
jgi:hypothetical protein